MKTAMNRPFMHRSMIAAMVILSAATAFGLGGREAGDFSYDSVRSVSIEAETFDVQVVAVAGQSATLSIERNPSGHTVYHERTSHGVRVWVERRFSLLSLGRSGLLVMTVPSDSAVQIDTSTGGVSVSGARHRVSIRTSTGTVDVSGTVGELSVSTSTGNVSIREADGTLNVRTSTGRIRIEDSHGTITSRSSTGQQSLVGIDGSIDATSSTGRLAFDHVRGVMRVKTSTGSQTGTAVVLTGDSSFEASTGRIAIELAQPLSAFAFDLRSTTGTLEVAGERSQQRLFLAGTGIRVSGTTSTGSQRFTSVATATSSDRG